FKVIVFSYYNFRTSALFIQLFLAKVLPNKGVRIMKRLSLISIFFLVSLFVVLNIAEAATLNITVIDIITN
ncbi:hypothetical protein J4G08_06780, partial [Candidatus Poribacteria bacterium]|nr:hypothetical protein [Candidatus Poribacteria bacterium]